MKFRHQKWTIEKWRSLEDRIDPRPQYQRGDVWDDTKRSLLIDSILSGYDIPKIYLRHVKRTGPFEYDVADGQQRLIALWRFMRGDLRLTGMSNPFTTLNGLTYAELPEENKKAIRKYCIIASIVYDASNDQIRELFRRLQLGVRLTPAELRNSMSSGIGNEIRAMAASHIFFKNSPFPAARFKTDDLLTHAFIIAINGPTCDVKAPNLRNLYEAYSPHGAPSGITKKVNDILAFINRMQEQVPNCIRTKWGFVDLVGVVRDRNLATLNAKTFANTYQTWEKDRLRESGHLDILRTAAPGSRQKLLFKYINAFQKEGGRKKNVIIRNRILAEVLFGRTS